MMRIQWNFNKHECFTWTNSGLNIVFALFQRKNEYFADIMPRKKKEYKTIPIVFHVCNFGLKIFGLRFMSFSTEFTNVTE